MFSPSQPNPTQPMD